MCSGKWVSIKATWAKIPLLSPCPWLAQLMLKQKVYHNGDSEGWQKNDGALCHDHLGAGFAVVMQAVFAIGT